MIAEPRGPVALIGGGFLGAAVVHQLAVWHPGLEVRVLSEDDLPPAPNAVQLRGSTTDADALYTVVRGADAVLHLGDAGAPSGTTTFATNVTASAAVVSAAITHGSRHLVYCSSNEVYGDCRLPADEPAQPAPRSRRGRSQLIGEQIVAQFGMLPGKAATVLRAHEPYGPFQRPTTAGRIVTAAITDRVVTVPAEGDARAVAYSNDIASGVLAGMYRDDLGALPQATYHLATTGGLTLRHAARLAAGLVGAGTVIDRPPYPHSAARGGHREHVGSRIHLGTPAVAPLPA